MKGKYYRDTVIWAFVLILSISVFSLYYFIFRKTEAKTYSGAKYVWKLVLFASGGENAR
jgi:hypothetical protein